MAENFRARRKKQNATLESISGFTGIQIRKLTLADNCKSVLTENEAKKLALFFGFENGTIPDFIDKLIYTGESI